MLALPAAAITWGTPDAGAHPYGGLVVFRDGVGAPTARSSGSLLTARIFLTSGHCAVLPNGAVAPVAEVWLDERVTLSSPSIVGVPSISPDGTVAVVRLDSDAPVARYAELPAVGVVDTLATKTALTLVGFGATEQDEIGGNPIGRWNQGGDRVKAPSALVSGSQSNSADLLKHSNGPGGSSGGACFHDSGGPVELGTSDVVLAINALVTNANCTGVGYGSRIDTADRLAWLSTFLP